MNKKFLVTALSISFFGIQASQAQVNFSLKESMEYADEHSYDYQKAKWDNRFDDYRILDIKTQGFPKLSGNVDYRNNVAIPAQLIPGAFVGDTVNEFIPVRFGTRHNVDIGAKLEQLIVDGRYFVGLQAQRSLRVVSDKTLELAQQNVHEEVAKAYYAVLVSESSKNLLTENEATISKLYAETKALYAEGFVEELDVDRISLALSDLRTAKKQADQNYRSAMKGLKFTMGMPMEETLVLTESLDDLLNNSSFVPGYEVSPSDRLEFQMLEETKKLRRYDIAQRRAAYFPSLYGFVNAGLNYQSDALDFDKDNWFESAMVGLSLNVPLFDGLATRVQVQQAKVTQAQNKIDLERTEYGIRLQAQKSYSDYLHAQSVYNDRTSNRALAQKIYDKVSIKYKEGVGSSTELLQAQRELATAQLNFSAAAYDLLIAKTNLQIALGKF